MNIHDPTFNFLPHPVGKIAMRIFQRLWYGEMLFKRDLALHDPSLAAAPARATRTILPQFSKFAQVCGALGCELRIQKRHYNDRVAGVLIDSEVRTSAPQMLTNFGIGTLAVNRTLSGRLAKHEFL